MKLNGETAAHVPLPPAATDGRQIGYIGKQLGPFLIQSELGRGGMATVYRAHDPRLGRDVAVKVMHGFFAGRADLEARFRREASAVAGIRHPAILALYDFSPPRGEEPGYLVSELIEGCDLRQLAAARGGRLIPEAAVLIAAQIADALGAAHSAGVVHRDVKPDNVLIASGSARVVLTDFGVAHVGGMDTMTATGAVLGSPAYMSPEQARGADVGPPSDVFSLGVLLYQLCTGHLPYSGKDPLTVLAAILRGDFVRPGKLEARVGPELERVMLRLLAREPAERPANGEETARALRGWLAQAQLGDEAAALRAFLDSPERFEGELSPRVAAMAVQAAEQARRRGQTPRAIAELGRALAYAPDDARAGELLAELGAGGVRRRGWRLGIGAAVLLVVGAGGAVAVHRGGEIRQADGGEHLASNQMPSAGRAETGVEVPRSARAVPVVAATASPPEAAPPPGKVSPPPSPSAEALRGKRRVSSRVTAAAAMAKWNGTGTAAAVIDVPGSRDDVAGGTEVIPASVATATTVAATLDSMGMVQAERAVAPRPASGLVLRASHGFCEPSLDDHPPSLRASYADLVPGAHDVFCTLPQGGPKVLVARYALKSGSRPTLIIVPGPEGRPVLARPE